MGRRPYFGIPVRGTECIHCGKTTHVPRPDHMKYPRYRAKKSCNNEHTRHPRHVFERPKHIESGENVFTATLPSKLQLRMKSGATISQNYRRLWPDQPSYTVTGSGGGGNHRDAELPHTPYQGTTSLWHEQGIYQRRIPTCLPCKCAIYPSPITTFR